MLIVWVVGSFSIILFESGDLADAGNAIWRGPPHYTGWVVDCLGDGLLPVLYVWWLGASQGVF